MLCELRSYSGWSYGKLILTTSERYRGFMKNLIFALALVLSPLTSFSATSVSCQGINEPDKSLVLYINGQKLVQVRVQTQGSLPKAFSVREIRSESTTSTYSMSGGAGLLLVENSVLNNQGGWLKMGSKRFECDSH